MVNRRGRAIAGGAAAPQTEATARSERWLRDVRSGAARRTVRQPASGNAYGCGQWSVVSSGTALFTAGMPRR